nr:hypothetical protein CFP56_45564 [Quercus suber]
MKNPSTLHLKNPSTSSPVMPRTTLRHTAPPSHASHSAYPSLILVLRRTIPHPTIAPIAPQDCTDHTEIAAVLR